MEKLFARIERFIYRGCNLIFKGAEPFQIKVYDSDLDEKRIVDKELIVNSSHIILTTFFTSKVDPQRKIFHKNDDFEYIRCFYESIIEQNLFTVIFHDGLSKNFISKYSCKNIQFVQCKILYYSLNDERFFIYKEFLELVDVRKVIMCDANDVVFNKDPFVFVNDRFNIGKDLPQMIRDSEWILKKIGVLPPLVRSRIPIGFYEMPLVNAGVIAGKTAEIKKFLCALTSLLQECGNDENNNMACVNLIFYEMYWRTFYRSILKRCRYIFAKSLNTLAHSEEIRTECFHMGKPFVSNFQFFETDRNNYITHK